MPQGLSDINPPLYLSVKVFYGFSPVSDSALCLKSLTMALSKGFVDDMCKKVNRVNDIIRTSSSLGKGLEIGHSYFCQLSSVEDEQEWWKSICKFELFPYLREICFDNEELGDELCHILSD